MLVSTSTASWRRLTAAVTNAQVTDQIDYLSAIEEGRYVVAQANAVVDEKGRLLEDLVSVRVNGETTLSSPDKVEYMDVAPSRLCQWLPRSFPSWSMTTQTER